MFSRKSRRYSPEDREQIIKASFETVDRLKKAEQDYAAQRVERRRGRLAGEADDEIIRRPVDDSGLVYKSAVQRQAPRATAGDDWNAWLDKRVADLLARERRLVLPIINEAIQVQRDAIEEQLHAMKDISREIEALRGALAEIRKAVGPARRETIEGLPNPIRTVN